MDSHNGPAGVGTSGRQLISNGAIKVARYIRILVQYKRNMTWMGALPLWVGLILFSSTSLAGKASDAVFTQFVARHVIPYDSYDLYHRYHVYFLAEKTVHLTLFIVLAIVLWRNLPDSPGKFGIVLLCGALIGCCSELTQCLFPSRDPALRDALINTAGTAIGAAASFLHTRSQRRSRGPSSYQRRHP
jgi:VanZ family protein